MKRELPCGLNLIPITTILVATIGTVFSSAGMRWYNHSLILPDITPPKSVFPIAWNLIFICTTIAAILVWNTKESYKGERKNLLKLFLFNAILNVAWSWIFFVNHWIGIALLEMILLEFINILIFVKLWGRIRLGAILMIPYILWVGFATYLTFLIFQLNS